MKKKLYCHFSCRNIGISFVFVLFFILSGTAVANNNWLKERSLTYKELFKFIEKKTGLAVVFDSEDVDLDVKVKFDDEYKTLDELLKGIFTSHSSLEYAIYNQQLIVKKKKAKSKNAKAVLKNKAQQVTVRGVVKDSDGFPLVGVSVSEKNTTNGTITNVDGEFSLKVKPESVLIFSYVGYASREIDYSGQTDLEVVLLPDVKKLEEIVVVGYGTMKKEEVTSSVAKVNSDQFVQGSVGSPLQVIQGKVAGLAITKSSGDPNAGLNILIRGISTLKGNASPLIVIDGVPGGDINTLRPEDIESIDVLKDGSAAAIYGTRGTAGVILVTTKSSKGMVNPEVSYSAYATVERMVKFPDMLSAGDWRNYMESQKEAGYPNEKAKSMKDYAGSTDWFDELTRTAFTHSHALQYKGGTKKSSYLASVNYRNAEGIMISNDREEFSVRLSANHWAMDDKLQLTLNLQNRSAISTPSNTGTLNQAQIRNPTLPVYDLDGNFFEIDGWDYYNPVAFIKQKSAENRGNNFLGSLRAQLEVVEGLKATGMVAYQSYKGNHGSYIEKDHYSSVNGGWGGRANRSARWSTDKTAEFTLDYDNNFGDHNINLMAGYSFQEAEGDGFSANNSSFLNDDFGWNNIGAGNYLKEGKAGLSSNHWKANLIGFFGRVNYNYDGRYMVSASLRREGSSKFGENNKWGLFPAVSAGWLISDEAFMENVELFEMLKLRIGYGVTGTSPINAYESIPRLKYGGRMFYNNRWIVGVVPASNANPDLKWETKSELNVGLEFSLLEGLIGGSVEYYNRVSTDLLWNYSVPVPPNLYGNMLTNVGEITNRGLEISLNAVPIKTKDFNWNLSFNLAHNTNKVNSLSNEYYSKEWFTQGKIGNPGVNTYSHRVEEGEPLGNFYGWQYEGLTEDG